MNEHEEELYQAIENNNLQLVKQLADAEFYRQMLGNGLIRRDAARADGNTLAHAVAKTGDVYYYHSVICLLNIDTYHRNDQGSLPEDLAHPWSNLHKNLKATREQQEAKNRHRERVLRVVGEERELQGHQSGIVFTSQLNLIYGSKNPNKRCEIPGDYAPEDGFSVFDKMVISEAFLVNFSQTVDSLENPRGEVEEHSGLPTALEATNYLLAHVGIVISDRVRQKGGEHGRIFLRMPVYFQNSTYMQATNEREHSEAFFYRVLGIEKNLSILFKDLFNQVRGGPQGRKAYALVWDFHSSQDMCDSCEDVTYPFQTSILPTVSKILTREFGMALSAKLRPLKTVVRVSSVRTPTMSRADLPTRNPEPFGRVHTHKHALDLKKSLMPLILHSDEQHRKQLAKWYSKKTYAQLTQKSVKLDRFTVFVNKSGYYQSTYNSPEEIVVGAELKIHVK